MKENIIERKKKQVQRERTNYREKEKIIEIMRKLQRERKTIGKKGKIIESKRKL